ncbi:MAG: Ig-like domain-containing protein [Bacteroidales bacterium]|nr:Ig-like domain-containing protein [Bacteroidales bacterium]
MNVDWRCYTSVNTNIQDSEVAFFKYYDDGKQEAGISFTPASATITWGETLDQPTLNNEHGLTVTYASSDPAVASLNGSTIVVNKAGTATITASWTEQVFDGVTYRAGSTDFALTVNKATPVVAFNNPTTTVNVGGSPVTNVATITPNTLAVTYSSSDDNVATVTESGVVTGIAEGTATITAAFAGNDNYEAATASYVMTVVDNRTFAVTITQPQTGGSFKVNVDGSEIATGASVQVNKTVTLTAVPATGYTLDAWTVTKTGDPTTVVAVSNDSFTMPAYAVTITASFSQGPQTLVASLSGAAMLNNAKSTSYADVTIDDPLTDTQGYKWTGRWVYQKASGVYYEMVQLKKYESSNSSRLAIPEYPGAIKSIKLTVTSANATTSDGAACTSELYFTQSYAKNGIEASGGKILTGGSSSGTNTIVLDFTELQQSYTSGYIVAGGGVRIWGVEVTYAATE